MSIAVVAIFFAAFAAHAQQVAITDANFTGPLLTPNPKALPPGTALLEPYLIYAKSLGTYDSQGQRHADETNAHQRQVLLPTSVGLTGRLTGHLTLGTARASSGGERSDGARWTDTTVKLQYMVVAPDANYTTPAVSVAYEHRFPTGAYDRLDANPLNGIGNGAERDRFSLYAQQYFLLTNGRPLRWRGYVAWSPAPSRVQLTGVSVYGTPPNFRGHVQLGASASASSSLEYSLDRHWVLVMEAAWDRANHSHLRGSQCATVGNCTVTNRDDAARWVYSIAPAIEYNFNSAMGLIAGTQMSVAGHHNSAFFNPQIALNMVF